MNVGEEICGEWLRHVKHCEFVQYNLATQDVQGEIDVIGINISDRKIYACEVAVHLITGLQYVKNRRPDNVPRLVAKFGKSIDYVRKNFEEYEHFFMFWSPVVRKQRAGAKNNQLRDVDEIIAKINEKYGVEIEPVINRTYMRALESLRREAGQESQALDSTVMRYLQIEERLSTHIERLGK